ncbi:MAG: hypothetical protein K2L06_02915 [Alistipes sp.]|nr:hypothetical protein [Alistipes sp.]
MRFYGWLPGIFVGHLCRGFGGRSCCSCFCFCYPGQWGRRLLLLWLLLLQLLPLRLRGFVGASEWTESRWNMGAGQEIFTEPFAFRDLPVTLLEGNFTTPGVTAAMAAVSVVGRFSNPLLFVLPLFVPQEKG